MATMAVPITVSPDAAEQIAKLGMQSEFDQIIEHLQQCFGALRGIEVILDEGSRDVPERCIIVTPILPKSMHQPGRSPGWELAGWFVETFPPAVCTNFALIPAYDVDNGR
jgi:hypothetical protein